MILGVGIDIVDVALLKGGAFGNAIGDFLRANFTPQEIATCEAALEAGERDRRLAARWAAKEAFIKALAATNRGHPAKIQHTDLRQVEVVLDAACRPALNLTGRVREVADGQGVRRVHCSLAHEGNMATAVVILED